MFLLKKIFLIIAFILFMYYGGAGTQSDSTAMQGMGFMGVLFAFIILYILFKIMWSTVSFIMGLVIFGSIIAFMLYCLGAFGDSGFITKLKNQLLSIDIESIAVSDNTSIGTENGYNTKNSSETQKNNASFLGFNPMDYPSIDGVPSVIAGDMLRLEKTKIKFLGVDAPDINQSCADRRGQSYHCGKRAKVWLQEFINGKKVSCHIVGKNSKRRVTGVCFLDGADIGAKMVSEGWAVAYTKNTDIYVAYENQAMEKRKGMWKGEFYRPEDWRKLQTRRAKVKIEKRSDDSGWFNFNGWF